jgi:hypothetical protein
MWIEIVVNTRWDGCWPLLRFQFLLELHQV